jgi:hypothetical protein
MTTTVSEQDWKVKAEAAFKKYLAAVERDLPPEAGVSEFEAVMSKHYQQMMSETLQALVDREPFPPDETSSDT